MRSRPSSVGVVFSALLLAVMALLFSSPRSILGNNHEQSATPEIERQRQRLSASDEEERRDALMRLGAMRREAASRAALVGLSDISPMVRAVAAKAILSINPDECVAALTPLVSDKDEFVRREVAYALGLTKSRKATELLVGLLMNDKEDGVRAAAAVGLGDLGDESGVVTLATVLAPQLNSAPQATRKIKTEKNVFVLRAAAKSLGQFKSRAGVPALIATLGNDKLVDDIRREAARSLGVIGDPTALPALQNAANSADPYLAEIALASARKIKP
jgi:HEAT repeat protein